MLTNETYLVRHGSYDHVTGNLNVEGIIESERAANELLAYGLGSTAVILSSNAPRAVGTADVISGILNIQTVATSERMRLGGNKPSGVCDLDEWALKSLDEAGITLGERGLIIVTHEPMAIVAASGSMHSGTRVKNGQVLRYEPGSWVNNDYRSQVAEMIEQELRLR